MTRTPEVSVAMATYDGARHVEEQLRSILDQLGPDDEVVVVDDASRDDTVARIEALGDPRVRVERRTVNGGYVSAFERALSLTRGEHVFLADQDDVWPPGRVATMRAALGRASVVAGNVAVLGGPERIRGPFGEADWRLSEADERRTVRNLARLAASDLPYFGSAMAVRRDALDKALPFPPSVRELHDAWLGLVGIASRSVAHVDGRVVLRRIHGANASGTVRSPGRVLRGRWWFLLMVRDARRRARLR